MHKLTVFFLFLMASLLGVAQHKQYEHIHEVGVGVGTFNYTGDLAERLQLRNSKPAFNAFYRYNFQNEVSVLRLNVGLGGLGADESNSPEPRRQLRAAQFSGSLLEVNILYEYDFFDFRDFKKVYWMSPYLYGGIGANTLFDQVRSTQQFIGIPFGAGIKLRLNGGWNLGVEMGARKNFSDRIDGVTEEQEFGSSVGTDWHYHAGVHLSYTFYKLVCKENARFGIEKVSKR